MPSFKPQPDRTLVKALARTWRWQRQLDEGVYISLTDGRISCKAATSIQHVGSR